MFFFPFIDQLPNLLFKLIQYGGEYIIIHNQATLKVSTLPSAAVQAVKVCSTRAARKKCSAFYEPRIIKLSIAEAVWCRCKDFSGGGSRGGGGRCGGACFC